MRPKIEDYVSDKLYLFPSYAIALEKYCDELEAEIKEHEDARFEEDHPISHTNKMK